MMLYKLVSHSERVGIVSEVISLTNFGPVGEMIESLGVPVHALKLKDRRFWPFNLIQLASWIKAAQPTLIQTWMYHADLIGGLIAKLAVDCPVVWGIRQSTFDPISSKKSTIYTAKVCAKLSSIVPAKIVCCSEASRKAHVPLGYNEDKMIVIPNGFELDRFRPDNCVREQVRREFNLSANAIVIGAVGRFHPQKDHRSLLQAAAIVCSEMRDCVFILCGEGVDSSNSVLASQIQKSGLGKRVRLLGRRDDMERILTAFDVFVSSSSFGEGFPNVIGEAMACGVPCVVTDVGDSAMIVADTGFVVPPRQSELLAAGLQKMLILDMAERRRLGGEARRRIHENYDLSSVAHRYANLYESVIA